MKRRSRIYVFVAFAAIALGWAIWPKSLMHRFDSAGVEVKGWMASSDLGISTYYYCSRLDAEPKIIAVLLADGFKEAKHAEFTNGERFFEKGDENRNARNSKSVCLVLKKDYLQIVTSDRLEQL